MAASHSLPTWDEFCCGLQMTSFSVPPATKKRGGKKEICLSLGKSKEEKEKIRSEEKATQALKQVQMVTSQLHCTDSQKEEALCQVFLVR